MVPLVSLSGVSKSFVGISVLRDIAFDVRPGEVHALLGENGAGKSTLIKVIAGVHRPDTGEIRVGGEVVQLCLAGRRARPRHRDRLSGTAAVSRIDRR